MGNNKFTLVLEGQPYEIERRDGKMVVNGMEFSCDKQEQQILVSGTPHQVKLSPGHAEVDGITYSVEATGLESSKAAKPGQRAARKGAPEDPGALTAIMPGLILKILKKEGDHVEKGETVIILEAMKMQNELQAKAAGVISKLTVKQGDNVELRQVLCIIS